MRKPRLFAALALVAAQVCWSAPPPPPKTERGVFRIPFWLSEGEPLNKTDMRIKVNGKPAKIGRWIGASEDLMILLIIDWSGDLSAVDSARKALMEAVEKLPPNVQVALMRAQDGLKVVEDPAPDRSRVIEALRTMTSSGRAGILDAIEPVQRLGDTIASKARVRVAAFYISDSNIYNYREDYTNPVVNSSDSGDMSRRFPEGLVQEKIRQLQATVLGGETPLFLVHLTYLSDRLNTAYQNGLLDLATASGGASEFCRSLADIPTSIQKVMGILVSHESVEVDWQPGKARQVDVALDAGGRSIHFRQRRHWKAAK